jgi:hypothetical protein
MPVLKNIASISEILLETELVPKQNTRLSKKDNFINVLENKGVDQNTVASAIADQFYSSDESIKDKAIERWLKLTEIIKPDGINNQPTVNIVIQGQELGINPILTPRDLT